MEKRTITSLELFGKQQEITILHAGEEYRLRITSNNKLIMTK
jgi:hemin uptake protein HemP